MSTEVEETIKRIHSHKGVKGVLIMNSEGIPIRAVGMTPEETENYAALVSQVCMRVYVWLSVNLFAIE
jgi:dynein light chain roadblock-type